MSKKIHYKDICNIESPKAKWEVTNFYNEQRIQLHYVPEEDYLNEDIKISVSYEEFEDLINLFKNIK